MKSLGAAAASGASQLVGRATGSNSSTKVVPAPDSPEKDREQGREKGQDDSGAAGSSATSGNVQSKAAGDALPLAQGTAFMKDAAGMAASAAKSAASAAASSAAPVASAAASSAAAGARAAAETALEKGKEAKDMAVEMGMTFSTDTSKRIRQYLEAFVKGKIQTLAEKLVDKLPGVAKGLLEDPEMPRCVSRGKDRLIDNVWPDMREEILWEVTVLLDGQRSDAQEERKGVDCFRAFFRYHLMPFDKGFWGQLKDPVQLCFRLFTMIPVYGASQFCFLFVFLVMDKSDEFQLLNFILGFKGTQFISMGLIRAVTGFFMFMMCVTAPANEDDHKCEDSGPGNKGAMLITSAGLFLQILLVWIAFVLLRCSVEKGRTQLQGHVENRNGQEGSASYAGGYIRYFLWYDLAVFCLCLILPLYCLAKRPVATEESDDWVLAHTIFAAQILYGMCSAPFFLFTLPGLQRVLTHAMPTGYDRSGRCRKFQRPKPPKEQKPKEDMVSEEDAKNLFDLVFGRKGDESGV